MLRRDNTWLANADRYGWESFKSPPERVPIWRSGGPFDFEALVERGGVLVRRATPELLLEELIELGEKLETLRRERPRLAAQLELMADFVANGRGPGVSRAGCETLFALIYCARECDLIPDSIPGIGYDDDAAVARFALHRNRVRLREHCRLRGLSWPLAVCGAV